MDNLLNLADARGSQMRQPMGMSMGMGMPMQQQQQPYRAY
jgi:hypothetical protein